MRVRVVLMAGLMAAAAVAALAAWAVSGRSSPDPGRSAGEKADVRRALIELKRTVAKEPGNAEARFQLGSMEFRLGDMVAAESDLIKARDNGYPIAKVNPLLANAFLAQGKLTQVLSSAAPCPDDASCRSDVLAVQARVHLANHEMDEAEVRSREALDAVPGNLAAQTVRALVLFARSDYAGAESMIDGVLKANGKLPEALMIKGDLRRQASDAEGALECYRSASALAPQDLAVRQRLALVLVTLERYAEGREEVNKVLAQAPQAVLALSLKADIDIHDNKPADALNTVLPAEAMIEKLPTGALQLAMIHAANAQFEQAINYATKFQSSHPDNLAGVKLLAQLYFQVRSYDRAISTLEPFRDRFADDSEALELLGSADMAEGRIAEATELLTRVAQARPDDAMAQARLAISRTRDASTRDAGIRKLETLVAADPGDLRIGQALLFSYLAAGQFDPAIEAATRMVAAHPESPMPFTLRGASYLARGDEAAARADFEVALAKDRDFIPAASYLAELAMRASDFPRARVLVDDLLGRHPDDLRALMARARIEARAGQPEAMLPFLQRAISVQPKEAGPRIELMQVLAGLGRSDAAARAANDLAQTQPRNPSAIDLAARTLLALKKTDDGLALYQKLQSDFPDSPQVHERLARALFGLGRLEDARAALDRAVSADRSYLPAWLGRAMLELRLNGFEAAKGIAEKALIQNPKNDDARVLVADLLVAANRLPEAETTLAAVMAAAPSTTAAIRLYRVIGLSGDQARARTVLADWLARHPDDRAVRTTLADGLLTASDWRGAAGHYETLAAKPPADPAVLNNLAWAYDRLGDSRALDTAHRAHTLLPASSEILDTYAWLLYRKGDAKLGSDLERRAYAGARNNPEIAYHMASVLANAGDEAGARETLKPIVEGKAVFEEAEQARALYRRLGGS